jgi:hypothetical protein
VGLCRLAGAEVPEVDQPKVDQPKVPWSGQARGLSLDRVVRFLVLLGSDVEIVVKPCTRGTGRARMPVAEIRVRNLYRSPALCTTSV